MRRADLTVGRSTQRLAAARHRPAILVTGFSAFGGARLNASEELVRQLNGKTCNQRRVVAVILPCTFGNASSDLQRAMHLLRPEIALAFGESDRDAVCPERVAVNFDDARIPDNRGRQPKGTPVVPNAPPEYRTMLPVERVVRRLQRRGLAARPSDSAGSYVCNHVFFSLLHHLATRPGRVTGGFIHVPAARGIQRLRAARIARAVLSAIRRTAFGYRPS